MKPLAKEDFAPNEPLKCGTCNAKEATHEISIRCTRGFDYHHAKQLYSVTYAVCEECAAELVTVKLGAELATTRRRRG